MPNPTVEGQRDPLTFTNAPTDVRDGVRYLSDDAAEKLGDRIASRYATLLERLSRE